jgi:hypothetical protein|tara:strand:- start:97 stop:594 length:498 start_codon:yes stop_codon:yes gene_type:complete
METTILIILLITIIILQILTHNKTTQNVNKTFSKIEAIQEELVSHKEKLNNIKFASLTDLGKEHAFKKADSINILFFEQLEKGQIVDLMSGTCHDHPGAQIEITQFRYKYDHIDRNKQTNGLFEIHGFKHYYDGGEWGSIKFFSNEKECLASNLIGIVKFVRQEK